MSEDNIRKHKGKRKEELVKKDTDLHVLIKSVYRKKIRGYMQEMVRSPNWRQHDDFLFHSVRKHYLKT